MSAINKFVRLSDVQASAHDCDASQDLGFMVPHFTKDWETEISDEELDSILAASEQSNHRRNTVQINRNRELAIEHDRKCR